MRNSSVIKDIIVSIILIGVSLVVYFWMIPNYVVLTHSAGMSPRFFPQFGTALVGIFSFFMLCSSIYRYLKNIPTENATSFDMQEFLYAVMVVFCMVIFVVIFDYAGYLWSAPVLILLLMVVFEARSPLIMLLTSALVTAVLFFAFHYGLRVTLI